MWTIQPYDYKENDQFCLNLKQSMFEWKTSKTEPAFWKSLKNSSWGTLFGRWKTFDWRSQLMLFSGVWVSANFFGPSPPPSKPLSYNSNSKQKAFIWALSLLFTGQEVERKITQYASHLKLPFGSKLRSYFKSKLDCEYKEESEFRLSGPSSDQFRSSGKPNICPSWRSSRRLR